MPDVEIFKADTNPLTASIAHSLVDIYNINANYCYPMFYQNDLLGALVIQYVNKTVLSDEDIQLLKTIVSQVSIGLKQAELYIQAQQSARFKSEFIATMSHEFRTPLNAIIGFTDMMLTGTYGQLPDKVNQYLGNVTKSGKHLLILVNDLLDISKIEAGKIDLSYGKFNASLTILDVVTGLNSLAIQKNLSIALDLTDVFVNADEIRFRQIIYNLLSNAIKFTHENGNVIVKSGVNGDNLVVSIEDTGIGIAKDDYEKIFEQFEQIDSSFVKAQGGTGLGLALTKKLIELQGGSIYFDSEVEQGSRFWFVLPLAPSKAFVSRSNENAFT